MRITDEARKLHKLLKAKNVSITREQIIEVLQVQSENAQYLLARGEPFEIYRVGTITPRIKNGNTQLKAEKRKEGDGNYTTFTFPFKIAPQIKKEAKDRIPKV